MAVVHSLYFYVFVLSILISLALTKHLDQGETTFEDNLCPVEPPRYMNSFKNKSLQTYSHGSDVQIQLIEVLEMEGDTYPERLRACATACCQSSMCTVAVMAPMINSNDSNFCNLFICKPVHLCKLIDSEGFAVSVFTPKDNTTEDREEKISEEKRLSSKLTTTVGVDDPLTSPASTPHSTTGGGHTPVTSSTSNSSTLTSHSTSSSVATTPSGNATTATTKNAKVSKASTKTTNQTTTPIVTSPKPATSKWPVGTEPTKPATSKWPVGTEPTKPATSKWSVGTEPTKPSASPNSTSPSSTNSSVPVVLPSHKTSNHSGSSASTDDDAKVPPNEKIAIRSPFLVTTLVIGGLLLCVVGVIAVRQLAARWQRRHYTPVNSLLNGGQPNVED